MGASGGVQTLFPLNVTFLDDVVAQFGTGGPAGVLWDTTDANANYWAFELPTGGAVDVPVLALGIGIDGVDLGLFDGIVQPTFAVLDADRDSFIALDFSGDDAARIRGGGGVTSFTIVVPAAASGGFAINDGTTNYYAVDTRVATSGVTAMTLDNPDVEFVNIATASFTQVGLTAFILNLTTDADDVTGAFALMLNIPGATITSATVSTNFTGIVSSVSIAGPIAGTNVILDTMAALRILGGGGGAGTEAVQTGIYIDAQTAGTAAYGLTVEDATTAGLWLSANTDSTDAAGGILFGSSSDTNLYRSAADTLRTDDSFSVDNIINASGDITVNPTASFNVTLTAGDADALTFNDGSTDYYNIDTQTAVSGATAHMFDNTNISLVNIATASFTQVTLNGYSMTITTHADDITGDFATQLNVLRTTISSDTASTNFTGIVASMRIRGPAAGTNVILDNMAGMYIVDGGGGGGTETVQYGIYIQAMAAGTSNYGIAIEDATTAGLWLSSNTDSTDAAGGILFGSSGDTNLYRSAANTLKTDDTFVSADFSLLNDWRMTESEKLGLQVGFSIIPFEGAREAVFTINQTWFAFYDTRVTGEQWKTLVEIPTRVESLETEVARLTRENEELRALMGATGHDQ